MSNAEYAKLYPDLQKRHWPDATGKSVALQGGAIIGYEEYVQQAGTSPQTIVILPGTPG